MSKIKENPVNPPSFFSKVKENPPGYFFRKLDSYSLLIRVGKVSILQLNLFKDDAKLRKVLIPLIAFAGFLWMIQGIDSSPAQVEYLIEHFPDYLMGKISWSQLVDYYMEPYGKFVHYSAFVIYMTFFVGISKYLHDKLDVVNSQNVMASICFTALTVGLFEFTWMLLYFFGQNLTWILSLQWPQARILLQNFAMIAVGLIFILEIDRQTFRFNFDKWTLILASSTVVLILIWYFYGVIFPIQKLDISVIGYGTWHSTPYFPQTVYTVDVNILDNVAAGEQYWIQNDLLHIVNTVTKVFLTLTLYNVLRLKEK